jgi:hypothetical protein
MHLDFFLFSRLHIDGKKQEEKKTFAIKSFVSFLKAFEAWRASKSREKIIKIQSLFHGIRAGAEVGGWRGVIRRNEMKVEEVKKLQSKKKSFQVETLSTAKGLPDQVSSGSSSSREGMSGGEENV